MPTAFASESQTAERFRLFVFPDFPLLGDLPLLDDLGFLLFFCGDCPPASLPIRLRPLMGDTSLLGPPGEAGTEDMFTLIQCTQTDSKRNNDQLLSIRDCRELPSNDMTR